MIQRGSIQRVTSDFLSNPLLWLKDRPMLVSSVLFFGSTTLVNLGNYLFNLVLGRWLGPTTFADLSLIVTIMLIITFATTAFSMATAKFVAIYSVEQDMTRLGALRTWLGRKALLLGLAVAAFLILGAPLLGQLFKMRSFWPFVVLGFGLPLFFLLSIDRGILQGQARFGRLSVSNQAEMWMRLLGAIAFAALGWAVFGASIALVLSFIAAWLVALGARRGLPAAATSGLSVVERKEVVRYFGPVVLGLMGQIVINNSDVLIVKSFFPAHAAGLYAALALIGRMVFYATWSVVMVMFPIVTQRYQKREAHRPLLWNSLGIIGGVSTLIVLGTFLQPQLVVNILFGHDYLAIAPLLWLYALATAFYALANVVVSYYLSLGNGKGSYLVLFAGICQVVGLLLWHTTLLEVVLVQVYIMAGLLAILLIWDQTIKRNYQYNA